MMARPRYRARVRKTFIRRWSRMLFLLLAQCPRKRMEWRPVRKVLIVRFGTLGESRLVFPILKSLKERLPGVHVEVLTGALPLWIMCPYVDRVVPFRFMSSLITALIRFRSYDVVIDTEPFGDYSAVLSRLFGKTCVGFRTGGRERLYDYSVPFNDQQYEVQTFLDLLQPICGPIRFDELIAPMVDPSLEARAAGRSRRRTSFDRWCENCRQSREQPWRSSTPVASRSVCGTSHENFPQSPLPVHFCRAAIGTGVGSADWSSVDRSRLPGLHRIALSP